MKAWIKCGLIGGVIGIILGVFYFIATLGKITILGLPYLVVFYISSIPFTWICSDGCFKYWSSCCNLLFIIIPALSLMLIGILIGWIVGKIKNKNMNK
jgi:hypothetical protein